MKKSPRKSTHPSLSNFRSPAPPCPCKILPAILPAARTDSLASPSLPMRRWGRMVCSRKSSGANAMKNFGAKKDVIEHHLFFKSYKKNFFKILLIYTNSVYLPHHGLYRHNKYIIHLPPGRLCDTLGGNYY